MTTLLAQVNARISAALEMEKIGITEQLQGKIDAAVDGKKAKLSPVEAAAIRTWQGIEADGYFMHAGTQIALSAKNVLFRL